MFVKVPLGVVVLMVSLSPLREKQLEKPGAVGTGTAEPSLRDRVLLTTIWPLKVKRERGVQDIRKCISS